MGGARKPMDWFICHRLKYSMKGFCRKGNWVRTSIFSGLNKVKWAEKLCPDLPSLKQQVQIIWFF